MEFRSFYSSSRSNLYCITAANGKRLLIECGVRWAKLQKALDYDLRGIEGCLVSHEHADHSRCARDVVEAGIDLYASRGTLELLGLLGHRRSHVVSDRDLYGIGIVDTFAVFPFALHHDSPEPFGFIINDLTGGEQLFFATDTSHITQRFCSPFAIICINVNYDRDVLRERVERGDINESLAKRLLTSHTEWRVALRYVKEFCNLDHCREIHLLHMSADNVDKETVRQTFERELGIKTFIAGRNQHGIMQPRTP